MTEGRKTARSEPDEDGFVVVTVTHEDGRVIRWRVPVEPLDVGRGTTPHYCPRCGVEQKPAPEPCTAERFRWDEDDEGHHCREVGPHTVHVDREHGCRWTEATA